MYVYTYNKLTKSNIETLEQLPPDWVDFFNSVQPVEIRRYWILSLLSNKKSAIQVSIMTGISKTKINNVYVAWGMRLLDRVIPRKFLKL